MGEEGVACVGVVYQWSKPSQVPKRKAVIIPKLESQRRVCCFQMWTKEESKAIASGMQDQDRGGAMRQRFFVFLRLYTCI